MKITSFRHLRRKERLDALVQEAGGATALAERVGTPKSHISAMQAGNRGVGDALAAKLEMKMGKPPGWMDADVLAEVGSQARISVLIAALAEVKTFDPDQFERLAKVIENVARNARETKALLGAAHATYEAPAANKRVRGVSIFGDLDEPPAAQPKKGSKQ